MKVEAQTGNSSPEQKQLKFKTHTVDTIWCDISSILNAYQYMSLFRNKAELYNEKRKAKNDYKISTTYTLKVSKKQNSPLTLCTTKPFVQTAFYIRDILLCTKFTVLT